MNVTLRFAKPGDAPDMAEVHARSWEAAYKDIIPMEYIKAKNATRHELYQRIITDENTTQHVIRVDDKTVGIMGFGEPKDDDADDSYYELHGIYLHPDYYRKGIGTQAVNFAFDKARRLGKRYMNVWVLTENYNSINFYKKCGFAADGKTRIRDFGKDIDSMRMKKDLRLEFPAENFYDKIADKYNWFFSSRNDIMKWQTEELNPVLEQFNVKTILDCSCGDGIQAIPLTKQGYVVDAGDISVNMLKKAAEYAKKENVAINFKKADFRELEKTFTDKYDCVLSWGNAIPHLMADEDIKRAVSSIYNRINENGVAIIEMRNWDKLLDEKIKFQPMRINDIQDGFRYSILYVYDYLPDLIKFNIVYLIENIETGEKHMEQETVDYNPIKRDDFLEYLKEAGFIKVDMMKGNRNCFIAQK